METGQAQEAVAETSSPIHVPVPVQKGTQTRITRMVMQGFKSFAKHTEIVFGEHLNCVLGPNGAGKSNVMDSDLKGTQTRITRMVMQGFKSFAKHTEIVFGEHLNCVLGPNGAGKSNVMDALCFVLGKSSSKDLRAEKAANFVYNGGKAKKPAKHGEVTICFSNSPRVFPINADEIKVTRIVKQSGQSIYRLNDETVTRREIVELLRSEE